MNPFQLRILIFYKTKEFYKDLLNIIGERTNYVSYQAREKEAYIKLGVDITIIIIPFSPSNCCGQRGDFIFVEKEAIDNISCENLATTLKPLQWSPIGDIYIVKDASEISFHCCDISTLNNYIKARKIKNLKEVYDKMENTILTTFYDENCNL